MKRIRQILSWISRKIIISFGKYFWNLFKKTWKGGLKMKTRIFQLLCLTGLSAGLVIGTIFFGWIFLVVTFGALVLILVLLFILIYFVLAPRNRWLTFVEEGRVKLIVRGGAFVNALIQWRDRTFRGRTKQQVEGDEEWEVIEGKEPWHPFGGLRLYSLWHPLDKIYSYQHRWTHLHQDGSVVTHEEKLDFVFLKEDIYVIELPLKEEGGTEDINGVPMGIKIALPMRIVNPYIAVYRVRRWLPMITGITQARFRRFVANYRYREDLLNMRTGKDIKEVQEKAGVPEPDEEREDLYQKFWGQIEEDFKDEGGKVVGEEEEKRVIHIYGVEINEKGARILEINPGKEYRRFTTMQYEKEIGAEARAVEILGTVIAAVVRAGGRTKEEVQAEFWKDPPSFYRKHQPLIDNTMTKLSMEERAYLRIETLGAKGFEKMGLDLLAAWQMLLDLLSQRMPGGKEKKEKETKKVEEKEMDETEKEMEGLEAEAEKEAKKLGIS